MKQMKIGKKNLCKPIESKDQVNTCKRRDVLKKLYKQKKKQYLSHTFIIINYSLSSIFSKNSGNKYSNFEDIFFVL